MTDLLEKLKSLGLKIEKASEVLPEEESTKTAIDEVIEGRWQDLNSGRVFVTEKHYPFDYSHGQISIQPPAELDFFSKFMGSDVPVQLKELLFIDTETSSLSSGVGSFVFLVGLTFFGENGLHVIQLFLDQPVNEIAFLNYLDEIIRPFNVFVSYNGKAFDIPMLRSRFILNRLPHELDRFAHFDLLHTARRIWKLRLDSRKLADIEKEILDFQRTDEEIPGWLVPQIYFDYLESGDASPLKGVFYHNEMDVVSLAAMLLHINQMLSAQPAENDADSLDIYSIGNTLSKLGLLDASEDFFQAGLDKGLPEDLRNEAYRNYAQIFRKQGKWTQAIHCWQQASENGDLLACIELAKFYEHRDNNIDEAMLWVEKAQSLVGENGTSDVMIAMIQHRKERLERKQENDR